jgi:hypothetical protein
LTLENIKNKKLVLIKLFQDEKPALATFWRNFCARADIQTYYQLFKAFLKILVIEMMAFFIQSEKQHPNVLPTFLTVFEILSY